MLHDILEGDFSIASLCLPTGCLLCVREKPSPFNPTSGWCVSTDDLFVFFYTDRQESDFYTSPGLQQRLNSSSEILCRQHDTLLVALLSVLLLVLSMSEHRRSSWKNKPKLYKLVTVLILNANKTQEASCRPFVDSASYIPNFSNLFKLFRSACRVLPKAGRIFRIAHRTLKIVCVGLKGFDP